MNKNTFYEKSIENTILNSNYDCYITETGEKRLIYNPTINYNSLDIEDIKQYEAEYIYNIKIGERDFNRLLHDIENNKSILNNLNDPIIHNMYTKLLLYIKLKA